MVDFDALKDELGDKANEVLADLEKEAKEKFDDIKDDLVDKVEDLIKKDDKKN